MPNQNSNGTPTTTFVATTINTCCSATGVPISLMTAIAQQESSFGQNPSSLTPNASNAVGVMQLTPIAVQQLSQLGYAVDANDPGSNIAGGTILMGSLLQHYNGNQQAAIAAFYEGPTEVDHLMSEYGPDWASHLPPGGASYLANVNQKLSNPNGVAPDNPVAGQNSVAIQQSDPKNNPAVLGQFQPDPITANPVPTVPIDAESYAELQPSLVVLGSDGKPLGLQGPAWYEDGNILTGNPRLKKAGIFPVTFQVYLDQSDPNSALTVTGKSDGSRITIPLNCSIERFSVTMRHVLNRTPTRTGFHITMWGMAADVIEGSGSTGMFMNQFGITDFLSLSGVPSSAVQQVMQSFGRSPSSAVVQDANGQQVIVPKTPLLTQLQESQRQQIASQDKASFGMNTALPEPFRIAAEDAFQELLALFKMNGTTWLHPSGYQFDVDNQTDLSTNQNQTAFYSPAVGASTYEIKARNNDVYRRGYVLMNFRNSQYLGFFKSLTWIMDAEKPFQWRFNFVFQVERTLSLVYYSVPAGSTTNVLPAAITATIPNLTPPGR